MNCKARVVLPVPGSPSRRYTWPDGRPPPRTSSRPGHPERERISVFGSFSCVCSISSQEQTNLDAQIFEENCKQTVDDGLLFPRKRRPATQSQTVSILTGTVSASIQCFL